MNKMKMKHARDRMKTPMYSYVFAEPALGKNKNQKIKMKKKKTDTTDRQSTFEYTKNDLHSKHNSDYYKYFTKGWVF